MRINTNAHAYSQGSSKARRDVALAADIKVVKDFETNVFSGASIETDNHNVDSLLNLVGVVRAWPNKRVALSPVEGLSSIGDAAAASNYTTHNATGVSKLHDRGIFGQGVKVGVVDSGTWYKHPAVGGPTRIERSAVILTSRSWAEALALALRSPVAMTWLATDVSSNAADANAEGEIDNIAVWPIVTEDKVPDDDPEDQLGHGRSSRRYIKNKKSDHILGTHVAGIIAGKNDL